MLNEIRHLPRKFMIIKLINMDAELKSLENAASNFTIGLGEAELKEYNIRKDAQAIAEEKAIAEAIERENTEDHGAHPDISDISELHDTIIESNNNPDGEKKTSDLSKLNENELVILRDAVAAFKDFIEYSEELKKANKKYNPYETMINICSRHPIITKTYAHVVELMCHDGVFGTRNMYDFLIMARGMDGKPQAAKDAKYDLIYIIQQKPDISKKQIREIYNRLYSDYAEKDEKKKADMKSAEDDLVRIKRETREKLLAKVSANLRAAKEAGLIL